jgi:cytochrome c oxidase assembly protein subunit 15
MVIVGAITRLTESGLSMVEWRPLIGALPPLNEAEWQRVFELYKATPEFRAHNYWMELADFQKIFFWEWLHRLLGRLIGLAYAVPLVWFWLRGKIPAGYKLPLVGLLVLGGLQGYMGWFMVQSGLVDRPSVSHYRLAAHLGLAFLIFCLLLKTALSLKKNPVEFTVSKPVWYHSWVAFALLVATIFWGAYTAGLDAGLIYNDTFPKMGETWVPYEMGLYHPYFVNFFENHAGVQFAHRWLAIFTGVAVLSLWAHAFYRKEMAWPLHALAIMVIIQIGLGIATLFTQVSLHVAVTHQAGALTLLALTVVALHAMKRTR